MTDSQLFRYRLLKIRTTHIQVWRSHHQVRFLQCPMAQPTDWSQTNQGCQFESSTHKGHQECQNHSRKHRLWTKHLENQWYSNMCVCLCAHVCKLTGTCSFTNDNVVQSWVTGSTEASLSLEHNLKTEGQNIIMTKTVILTLCIGYRLSQLLRFNWDTNLCMEMHPSSANSHGCSDCWVLTQWQSPAATMDSGYPSSSRPAPHRLVCWPEPSTHWYCLSHTCSIETGHRSERLMMRGQGSADGLSVH